MNEVFILVWLKGMNFLISLFIILQNILLLIDLLRDRYFHAHRILQKNVKIHNDHFLCVWSYHVHFHVQYHRRPHKYPHCAIYFSWT